MSVKAEFVRFALLLLIVILLAVLPGISCCCSRVSEPDIIIKNGQIVDGTGKPSYQADLAIKDGRIVEIGRLKAGKTTTVIDAKGLYVAPGFIDVHTHTDRKIDSEPAVMNYLLQGVTTVVGGNCGGSRYPLSELFGRLEEKGIAINFASLVGHNTIRREVMGNDDRAPTAEELAKMQELVRQEMLSGAIGFSTGLSYVPGQYSTTEEIIELVKTIEPFDGIYATHMRNQGKYIKEAIEEAVRIGTEAAVAVEISHIKLADDSVWGKYNLITEPVEQARRQGLKVHMDQYPYTAASTGFTSSFPGWAVSGGHSAFVERLKDPNNYQKIKEALIERRFVSARGIDKLKVIYVAQNKNHPEYEGKNLAQILELLGRDKTISNAADLMIEMQKNDRPGGIFFLMAEEDVAELMRLPYNMIASDGKVEIPGKGVPHPRAYGTFPRVLAKYVRQSGVLSLLEAIRKMTSLPAQAMLFRGRGGLKPGMYADIVIFNLEELQDTATFENPHQYPKGIPYVLVNGKLVVDKGKWTGIFPGKVIYGSGKSMSADK